MAASSKNTISFIIPTLNSGAVLNKCLDSIISQEYDKNFISIIIVDGGSTDNTQEIAKHYNAQIINNPLKTAESAKALGIKHAKSTYIALVDSDNILPNNNWLKTMLLPFKQLNVIGSEPWSYTYRKNGGFIERYSALTGVNDPFALISNNYDRINYLRPSWNSLQIHVSNFKHYQIFSIDGPLPSIGANGTVYKTDIVKKYFNSLYLIDVDLLSIISKSSPGLKFAKAECGIIHTYCESSINKFIKKQNRRVTDLFIYQNDRPKNLIHHQTKGVVKFTLYVISIIPMILDTFRGYIKKPDPAWLFHPIACIITLYIYGINTIKYSLGLLKPIDRNIWRQ